MAGPEYAQVEEPLIRQLQGMGWTHVEGAPPGALAPIDPTRSGRESFGEVFLTDRLRRALVTLNTGPDGGPWLDERRIAQAVNVLARIGAPGLLEANQRATDLLINGTTVNGLRGWEGGRDQRVHFIDWAHPERNDFVVVSQLRVDIPGTQGKRFVTPDEVLFVNGIPLVVVECKKPGTRSAILEAVKQLHRYAERRASAVREGNARLFHTVQLTVATCGDRALLGTFTADAEHYAPWRDPYPLTRDELAQRLKKRRNAVSAQDVLVGVVAHPYRLLDIVHNYVTLNQTDDGRTVKIAPRYQQYRAVDKAITRLATGKTRREDGYADRRGGIVWHTQGSGKSLTMTFLVRKLRATPDLAATKVVVVTDRTQLQGQLSDTMQLAGERIEVANRVASAKRLLARHGPGVVFVMIQKQQDVQARRAGRDDQLSERHAPSLGELNTDESMVVLIDEAHRSHGSRLHMNLLDALPNCARIGFTGTPILMGKKKKTTEIFGPFIDTYKLKEAERDGVIVPIFYEGHTIKGAVRDGRDLDEVFEDMFAEHTEEERAELQRKYATRGDVLDAERLIAGKARNMLRHYVGTVLPGRFKAQLVAGSREATVRYREALLAARDELVGRIEALPPHLHDADPEEISDRRTAFLVRARRHLDLLRAIDFVPVISPGTANDEQRFTEWTDQAKQERRIEAFTSPFPDEPAPVERPVAFLLVKSMLLTGFDAPIEQVLYVDRSLKEAELLQAVARVNRTAERKMCGYVVDYYGVANHLKEALAAYAAEDIEGALKDLRDEIAKLDPRHVRTRLLFTERGVTPRPSEQAKEDCVALLEDPQLRDRFDAVLKQFLTTVDTVLPHPDAKPYLADATLFAEIQLRARRRYRVDDGDFNPSLYGEKVRELIDEHMESLGVEQVLPPVSLTAHDFREKVEALAGPRAKASEMEHAIRHHIDVRFAEDPTRYTRLSQRLEEILAVHKENWERQALALSDLIAGLERDEPDSPYGLGPVCSALYGVLLEDTATNGVIDEATGQRVADFARKIHALAVDETGRRDFWRKPVDQANFTKQIAATLVTEQVCEPDLAAVLADRLFEVIKANRGRLARG
ncbi:MAG: type I restriction endonuclease subunit R [Nocardioidaceae bacterium]